MKKEKSFSEYLSSLPLYAKLGVAAAAVSLILLMGPLSEGSGGESDPPTGEESLAELCSSVAGVGRCRVMIVRDSEEEVSAVAVLCEGAESVSVREEILELISSLYGIGTNRITVLKISD